MAITAFTATRLGPTTWRMDATSSETTPTYYWYVGGVLVETSSRPWKIVDLAAGESLWVEVFDDSSSTPVPGNAGRLIIDWGPVSGASVYRVYEYYDSAWTLRAEVPETGLGQYEYQTRYLENDTDIQWRVVAYGTNGILGTVRQFTAKCVRGPDAPEVTYTYSVVTGKVTVS